MNKGFLGYLNEINKSFSHKNYLMTDGFAVSVSAPFYTQGVNDMDGVVWIFRWRDIETSEGVYNFNTLNQTLDYLSSMGKKCIPRIYFKSFLDANDPPTPASLLVPDYVLNDTDRFGGATGSGGMFKGYNFSNGGWVWQGWTVNIVNTNVRNRIKALITALISNGRSRLSYEGFCFDEFVLGLYHGIWPDGVDQRGEISSILDLTSTAAQNSKYPTDVYVGMNYLDADQPPVYNDVRALTGSITSNGMKLMLPDVFLQELPVYRQFAANGGGIATIDSGDRGADDAGLQARSNATYNRSLSLNPRITAWYYHGATSNYWTTALNSINAG